MAIISIRDLVVEYGGRRVLDGLNLDIEPGEIMVLLGGSGAGKSTLLRQIIGLERPKSGSVLLKGVDITRCSPAELKRIRLSMGVAFQDGALFNSLTVKENVALALREHTALAPAIIDLVVWMNLAVVGLADFENLLPQELSGGMKKRAAVARALALDPEILVFDEPSAGLDPIVAAELDELILLLKKAFQMTVIVVTHELPSAFHIADRIAMLYKGSFLAVGTKEEIKASQDPRIRKFLDRVPDNTGPERAAEAYFEKYVQSLVPSARQWRWWDRVEAYFEKYVQSQEVKQ
jgi:phospholipid/cholesterol/gamma-HCH transport system ATP-binding protein